MTDKVTPTQAVDRFLSEWPRDHFSTYMRQALIEAFAHHASQARA